MTIPFQVYETLPFKVACGEAEAYYSAVNPTPGTALATIAAQTTLADTSPFVSIIAAPAGAGAKSVYLDYLKLIVGATGTGGTSIRYAMKLGGAGTPPSGGTTLTPANATSGSAGVATCSIFAGPLIAVAPTSPKLIAHGLIRPVIPVVADTYLFDFGPTDAYVSTGLVPSGAANADRYFSLPPVTIRPGGVGHFHVWLPGQTVASSYELEIGFFEF